MSIDEKESDSSVDPLFCTVYFPSDMEKVHIAIPLPTDASPAVSKQVLVDGIHLVIYKPIVSL